MTTYRNNGNGELTLRQRRLVSSEVAREFRAWRRKKGEPTEAQRQQIIAIGFAKARRKSPSIPNSPQENPVFWCQRCGEKAWTSLLYCPKCITPADNPTPLAAAIGGAAGAIVMNALANPSPNPSTPVMEGDDLEELQSAAHANLDPANVYWVITGPKGGKYSLRVDDLDLIKARRALQSVAVANPAPNPVVAPGGASVGQLAPGLPGFRFYGNLYSDSSRTQMTLAAFKDAGIKYIAEGGGNLLDVYVHKDDWERALMAAKGVVGDLRREYGYGENPHSQHVGYSPDGGTKFVVEKDEATGEWKLISFHVNRKTKVETYVGRNLFDTEEEAVQVLRAAEKPYENPLTLGSRLPHHLQQEVLRRYIYRWTTGNTQRAQVYNCPVCSVPGGDPNGGVACRQYHPTMPLQTDAQWLATHSFNVTKDGRLSQRQRHAEPGYMAEANPLTRGEVGEIESDAQKRVMQSYSPGYDLADRASTLGRAEGMREVAHKYGPRPNPQANSHLEGEPCDVCGGPLNFMGTLGAVEWYRCRNCGMEIQSQAPGRNPLTESEAEEINRESVRDHGHAYSAFSDGLKLGAAHYTGRARRGSEIVGQYGPRHNPVLMTVMGANPGRQRPVRRRRSADDSNAGPCARCGGRLIHVATTSTASGPTTLLRCSDCGAESSRLELHREYGYHKNPGRARTSSGPRRKTTMSLEKFAAFVKSKNDPKLWAAFVKKVKGYQKWTHGSMPKTVTVETVNVPGVSGLWMTYGMGREPEKVYVMPKGSKRKGAWKHPWTKMPYLKGDPEAGIILTKLVRGNKITDFLHG